MMNWFVSGFDKRRWIDETVKEGNATKDVLSGNYRSNILDTFTSNSETVRSMNKMFSETKGIFSHVVGESHSLVVRHVKVIVVLELVMTHYWKLL